MALSRIGASCKPASFLLISDFHSGMFESRHAVDGSDERLPDRALRGQYLPAVFCQLVIAPPPLPGFLHPLALNPAALFQPVEQRIKRSRVELEHAIRAPLDQFAELVTVPHSSFQQRQDEQLGAALLQFTIKFLGINR